jgi:riboflavin biosynthesis pyrimidine reductase
MVEGGTQVLNSFFELSQSDKKVDMSAIVTVSPQLLGAKGVGLGAEVPQALKLADPAWYVFGTDVVVCGRLANKADME